MKWTELNRKQIKQVYYLDEHGDGGSFVPELGVHLIYGGPILLELEENQWVSIESDPEREGLSVVASNTQHLDLFQKVHLKGDPIWSRISNKTIKNVIQYPGQFSFENAPGNPLKHPTRKEITCSIELVFQHGESLFISNAEVNEALQLESSVFSLVLYTRRAVGIAGGLIS